MQMFNNSNSFHNTAIHMFSFMQKMIVLLFTFLQKDLSVHALKTC